MSQYNIVVSTDEATVVAEYIPKHGRASSYQSESDLERGFIKLLESQGYEYLSIHEEDALINNLRIQLEKLNDYSFSDKEWERFFFECIATVLKESLKSTRKIQADHVLVLRRDEILRKNIYLII
jgi:type I restriction enzyme R subunit